MGISILIFLIIQGLLIGLNVEPSIWKFPCVPLVLDMFTIILALHPLSSYSSSQPASVYRWHVRSSEVVFQPFTDAKEKLDYVPIDIHLCAKPFCSISPLLVPT